MMNNHQGSSKGLFCAGASGIQIRSCLLGLAILCCAGAVHAATVTWDGGGDGTTWGQATNWAGDVLPGTSDDVVINMGGSATVKIITTAVAVKSVQCQDNLELTSASLTVTGPSTVGGTFKILSWRAIYATGSTASFTVLGTATIDNGGLYATNGGHINLPTATQYIQSNGGYAEIIANGAGSRIDLPNIHDLRGPSDNGCWDNNGHYYYLSITAKGGGVVNLCGVQQLRNNVMCETEGLNSKIDFSALTIADGSAGCPNPQRFYLSDQAELLLPVLDTATNVSFYVFHGLTMDLSSLTSYSNSGGSNTIAASMGGIIDLSGLTDLRGPYGNGDYDNFGHYHVLGIGAASGGVVDLSSLPTLRNNVYISATGKNSKIDLSAMTSADNSGGHSYGMQFSLKDQAEFVIPVLETVINSTFRVYDGLTMPLGSVATYQAFTSDQTFGASGVGSKLDFSGLTDLRGPVGGYGNFGQYYSLGISASSGGLIDFQSLQQIRNTIVTTATGHDSNITFPSLTLADGTAGVVQAFVIGDQGAMDLHALQSAANVGFQASGGLTLSLDALVNYVSGTSNGSTIKASGAGSLIDFPVLNTMIGPSSSYVTFNAATGGHIRAAVLGSLSGRIALTSSDSGSVIELPSLGTWYGSGGSSLAVSNGGGVVLGANKTTLTTIPVSMSSQGLTPSTISAGTLEFDANSPLSGTGVIQGKSIFSCQVYPGGNAGYGYITCQGNCTFNAASKLHLDIMGMAPLVQYDQFTVTGALTLAGPLNVYLLNSYVPLTSDKFDVVMYGSHSGAFTTVTWSGLPVGRTIRSIYRPNRLVLGELAGMISPAVPPFSTPRNVAASYDLTPHNRYAAQPNWRIEPADTPLFTAAIDGNHVLTITPKPNASGTALPTLTLKDLADGYEDVQPLDLTVQLILPTAPTPFIFPTGAPMDTDNLVCGLLAGTVGPGCPMQYRYTWTNAQNPACGGNCPAFTSKTIVNGPTSDVVDILDASNTSPQEIWTCTVHTYDGQYYSALGGSASSGVIKELDQSQLSLNVTPTSIRLGEYVTLSGGITPVVGVAPVLFDETIGPGGTPRTKPPTVNTGGSSTYSFSFLPDEAGSWAFGAKWQGDRTHFGDSAVAGLSVSKVLPTLTLTVTPSSLLAGESDVTATAVLSASVPDILKPLLADQTVKLYLRLPDGSSAGPVSGTTDADGAVSFAPADFAGAGVNFATPGTYQFLAEFDANDNFLHATSPNYDTPEVARLTVKDSAGYAIICVGKLDANGEGRPEHTKTADGVYRSLRGRGFAQDDIYYLREGAVQPSPDIFVDDTTPSQADLRQAIEVWAKNKMNAAPGPLYLVLLDHGGENAFYVYSGYTDETRLVSPVELDQWLDTLQQGLNPQASSQDLVLVVGSCHSGSFIPALSGIGRTIITSTMAGEVSHRGVKDPNDPADVRDGEPFVTEFFQNAVLGRNLRTAFVTAADHIESFTAPETNGVVSGMSPQHPLLDDNADGEGVDRENVSAVAGRDGARADALVLGYGVNASPSVGWIEASRTLVVDPGAPVHLYARATEAPATGHRAWIEIKPPHFGGAVPSDSALADYQRELQLATRVSETVNPADGQFRWDSLTGLFDTPGAYRVYYFIRDGVSGETSAYLATTVYRRKADNHAPAPVVLEYPVDMQRVPTWTYFSWLDSSDPDGDGITYRLELAEDAAFTSIVAGVDGIVERYAQVPGLSDGVTLYWRVIPVDDYGASPTTNTVRSVILDNTNMDLTTALTGAVTNEVTGAPLAGVAISIQADGTTYTAVTNSRGAYARFNLPQRKSYRVETQKTGYLKKAATFWVENETAREVNFALRPANLGFRWGDMNNDGKMGLSDAGLLLQWIVRAIDRFPVDENTVYPSYPPAADVNGGGLYPNDVRDIMLWRVGLLAHVPADTDGDGYGPEGKALAPEALTEKKETRNVALQFTGAVTPGQVIRIPLVLDDATNVSDWLAEVHYDGAVLGFEALENGALVPKWDMLETVSEPGSLRIVAVQMTPVAGGSGALVTVRFKVLDNAAPGATAVSLGESYLNSNTIALNAQPARFTVAAIPAEGEGEGEATVEGEGEIPPEGEGELVLEGEAPPEGEAIVEGEGEVPPEGEIEGETVIEGEDGPNTDGEVQAEGEGETVHEGEGGVEGEPGDTGPLNCKCTPTGKDWPPFKNYFGDLLLLGLSLSVLLQWNRRGRP